MDKILSYIISPFHSNSSATLQNCVLKSLVPFCWPGVIGLFKVVLLIRVTADGDDADGWAGGVRDDDGLARWVVLTVVISGGATCLLSSPSPYSTTSAGLWWAAGRGHAILNHGTPRGCVLLHSFGALRWRHRLGGGHVICWHVPKKKLSLHKYFF